MTLLIFLYSPPDHEIPFRNEAQKYREGHSDDDELRHAQHRYIPSGLIKPNPEVLLDIVHEVGRSPDDCVYVGDSLMKDVAMAQDAGITDVFAEYGGVQHKDEYELLQRVSHWTDEDVQREKDTSKRHVNPTHTISHFSEIVAFF